MEGIPIATKYEEVSDRALLWCCSTAEKLVWALGVVESPPLWLKRREVVCVVYNLERSGFLFLGCVCGRKGTGDDEEEEWCWMMNVGRLVRGGGEQVVEEVEMLDKLVGSMTSSDLENEGQSGGDGEGARGQWMCSLCNRSFTRKYDMYRHVRGIHESLRPFVCELCTRKFKQRSHLNAHVRVVHDKVSFKCDYCDKRFGSKSNLKKHARVVHFRERPFQCSLCHATFFQNFDYQRHLCNVHHSQRIAIHMLCNDETNHQQQHPAPPSEADYD